MGALLCIALTVYFEARDQSLEGQIAVAQVVVNRMHSPSYPGTACAVVHEGPVNWRGNPIIGECQFDWYCDGKSDTPKDWRAFRRARVVAALVLAGQFSDKAEGSTHYHSLAVHPEWGLERVKQIGKHVFYR